MEDVASLDYDGWDKVTLMVVNSLAYAFCILFNGLSQYVAAFSLRDITDYWN